MMAGWTPHLKTRQQLEDEERQRLAPYAQFSADSAGRLHHEPPHPFRTAFQRDRSRIVHSRAFRRLANKTQVFLSGTGDHLRTRLTHTIEVASAGRTIATALGAHEDLVDCIALAHDLGHPPFGHCGEARLHLLMQDHGGFEHNLQSLRILEKLDLKYPGFPGLNLSAEVLAGLHNKTLSAILPTTSPSFPSPSLEAQIADLADEITYYSHDLDDGLDHGLIHPEELDDLELWRLCRDRVREQFPTLTGERFQFYVIRSLTDFQLADASTETLARLVASAVSSANGVRQWPTPLAAYSPALTRANRELRRFLQEKVYHHPSVAEPNEQGCLMIEALFAACIAEPALMGAYYSEGREDTPLPRIVCDYISGMTDRFLVSEYRRICAPPAT